MLNASICSMKCITLTLKSNKKYTLTGINDERVLKQQCQSTKSKSDHFYDTSKQQLRTCRLQRDTGEKDKVVALENKVRELELELQMEQTHKTRHERQIKKLRDNLSDVSFVNPSLMLKMTFI